MESGGMYPSVADFIDRTSVGRRKAASANDTSLNSTFEIRAAFKMDLVQV